MAPLGEPIGDPPRAGGGASTVAGADELDLAQLTATALPARLAALHRACPTRARVRLRLSTDIPPSQVEHLLVGAGFEVLRARPGGQLEARRVHTLPDYVRPGLRLLVCGLNPSPYAAESGVPFARPGNRFWPAALAAGVVSRDRDVDMALFEGCGFTDWVKRTTRRAQELRPEEFRAGYERLCNVVALCRPLAVCFVGLQGFRSVFDRTASAGWTLHRIEDRPVYLMPSTSGLNAHSTLEQLTEHLRCASRAAA